MTDSGWTLEDLSGMLAFLPAHEREIWVQVGMGIKAEFGEAGFDAWDAWSAQAENYDAKAAKSTWRSCKVGSVTFGTVVHLAKQHGWTAKRADLTPAERRAKAKADKERRAARLAELEADEQRLAALREAVSKACQDIFTHECRPVGQSPYLGKKRVRAYEIGFFQHTVLLVIDDRALKAWYLLGERVQEFFRRLPKPRPDHISFQRWSRGTVAIPLRDIDGKLWSLQVINNCGKKLFPKYGRKSGCFHLIGNPSESNVLAVAEGYATAASIYAATKHPVAVAFDAGNLATVVPALRARYPDKRLLICADNDATTKDNPGVTKAKAVAAQVGALVAIPDFSKAASA
jgi:putative DNA primase/helicase